MESYIKAPLGGTPTMMDHTGKSFNLDFAAGTHTSAFSDAIGSVEEKHYYEGGLGNHNIIVTNWDGSKYPNILVENDGKYWETDSVWA